MESLPPIAIFLIVCAFGLTIVMNIIGLSMMNDHDVVFSTLAPISSPTLPPMKEMANDSSQVLQDSEIASGSELLAKAVSDEMLKSTSDSESKPMKATKKELFQQCKNEIDEFMDQEKYHNLRHAAADFFNTKSYLGEGGSTSFVHDEMYSNGAAKKVFQKICSEMGWSFLDSNKLSCSGSSDNKDFFTTITGYATCIPNSEACVGVGDYVLEYINDLYANRNYTNQECHYEKTGYGYYDKNFYAIDSKISSGSSSIRKSFSSDDDLQQCQDDRAQMLAENPRMSRAEKSFFDTYDSHSYSSPSSKFKTYLFPYKTERKFYRKACTEGGGMFVEAPKPISCTSVGNGSRLTITTRRWAAYCIADTVACGNVGAEYAFKTLNNYYMNKVKGGKQCSYDDDGNHRGLRGAR